MAHLPAAYRRMNLDRFLPPLPRAERGPHFPSLLCKMHG